MNSLEDHVIFYMEKTKEIFSADQRACVGSYSWEPVLLSVDRAGKALTGECVCVCVCVCV